MNYITSAMRPGCGCALVQAFEDLGLAYYSAWLILTISLVYSSPLLPTYISRPGLIGDCASEH